MEVAVESFVTAPFAKVWSACTARMAVQVGGFGFDLYGTCAQIVPNRPIKYCFGARAGAGEIDAGARSSNELAPGTIRPTPARAPTQYVIGLFTTMRPRGRCKPKPKHQPWTGRGE